MPSRILALYHKPQVQLSCRTGTRMFLVSLCAFAGIARASLNDGGNSLTVCFAALTAALITETLCSLKRGHITILDGSAAASAFVLTLLLPNGIDPALAAVGAIFAIAVTKFSYGGLGSSWLNPALSGWFFLRISWPSAFTESLSASPLAVLSKALRELDRGSIGSPIEYLQQNGFEIQGRVTSFFNEHILKIVNIEFPAYYLDFFSLSFSGIIGDNGIFVLIFCSVLLLAFNVSRFMYSAIYLAVYLILVKIFGSLIFSGLFFEGDMLFCLFTGGTIVTAVFLLPEPASSPKTSIGKMIAAIIAAFLSFYFRYVKNEAYGAFFAIIIVNMLVPLIRSAESVYFFNKAKHLQNVDIQQLGTVRSGMVKGA
ncbi:MAG: hypothetical protein Ta2F_07430 [Termitinemataceae bacterium]|nr:MAG: hypothetical protein Ta2F_07430 [Termitinemataceae bacterium]